MLCEIERVRPTELFPTRECIKPHGISREHSRFLRGTKSRMKGPPRIAGCHVHFLMPQNS